MHALAGIAGYVDAVGYLAFDHIFVANMTGNSVLLGISAVQGRTDATLRSALALLGFIAGASMGTMVTDARRAEGLWPSVVTAVIGLESVALLTVAVGWAMFSHGSEATLGTFIAGTAIAMGLQSAAARKLAVRSVATVVLTGTLTSLVARAVARIRERRWTDPTHLDPTAGPAILFGVWAAYVVGAGLGAWVAHVNLPLAIVPPATLVSLIALGALRLFQRKEENEHAGR